MEGGIEAVLVNSQCYSIDVESADPQRPNSEHLSVLSLPQHAMALLDEKSHDNKMLFPSIVLSAPTRCSQLHSSCSATSRYLLLVMLQMASLAEVVAYATWSKRQSLNDVLQLLRHNRGR